MEFEVRVNQKVVGGLPCGMVFLHNAVHIIRPLPSLY